MNHRISPWNKPGADHLRTMLGGDPATDTVLTRVINQLDLDACAQLSGLVVNALREHRHAATLTAYEDILVTVTERINEVKGHRP